MRLKKGFERILGKIAENDLVQKVLRYGAIAALATTITTSTYGQQEIRGRVIDGLTGTPKDSIEVIVNKNGTQYKTITDQFGEYNLNTTGVDDDIENIAPELTTDINIENSTLEYNTPNPSNVQITFCDAIGQKVSDINESVGAGRHTIKIPTDVASGVYAYGLQTKDGRKSGKYVVVNRNIVSKSTQQSKIITPTAQEIKAFGKANSTTQSISFIDTRIPKKHHDYIDTLVNLDTVGVYDNVAWPIIKLEHPFDYEKTVFDMAKYFTSGEIYTGGKLKLPVQLYVDGSQTTPELSQLWSKYIKEAQDTCNKRFKRTVSQKSERPYGWDYWDREYSGVIVKLINDQSTPPLNKQHGTIDLQYGAAGQMNAIIYLNTTYWPQDKDKIISVFSHEFWHRFFNYGGPPNNFGIPTYYSAAVASDTRRAVYPHVDEMSELKILFRINDLLQNVRIDFYQKAQ